MHKEEVTGRAAGIIPTAHGQGRWVHSYCAWAELLGSFPPRVELGVWSSRPTRISISDEEAREGFSPFIPLQILGFQPKVPTVKSG